MTSADEESLSPKNRLKLLCSYGGKIMPRPSDGQLKYVGGETRVLAVARSISFSELKKRIREMFNNAKVVIKYQIMPEDLDALVSVTCDEDLRHMLDEYDRQEPRSPSNAARFRLFIFSAAPPPLFLPAAATPIEKRYVEAINGIPPATTSTRSLFTISAFAATSPTSACGGGRGLRRVQSTPHLGGGGLPRVHSTPNLGGGTLSQMANGGVGNRAWPPYLGQQQHHHHHHQDQQGPQAYGGGVGWRAPSGPLRCGCGCGCRVTAPPPHVRGHQHPLPVGSATGNGGCVCFGRVDEHGAAIPLRGGPPHSSAFGVAARKLTPTIWE